MSSKYPKGHNTTARKLHALYQRAARQPSDRQRGGGRGGGREAPVLVVGLDRYGRALGREKVEGVRHVEINTILVYI